MVGGDPTVARWTTRDGTRIAYRRAGTGPGTILVHGGFIDGSSMTNLMGILAPSRTVFAPDRRGHGLSSPYEGPHVFSDDVNDLVEFTNHVFRANRSNSWRTRRDVTSHLPPHLSRR